MRATRPAFTLTDLLVLLAALAVCATAGAGAAYKARESADRIKCASNLRQIGQALLLYSNENANVYPRTRYDPADPAARVFTAAAAKNPFAAGGPGPNDVTAAMFLLLRTQDITPAVFICPLGGKSRWDFGGPTKTAQDWSNFPNLGVLSYSMNNPYLSPAAVKAGAVWDNTLNSGFAVAADLNPGGPALQLVQPTSPLKQQRAANSPNHGGDGQNVLYGDGHVSFSQTVFCGTQKDNIYTNESVPGAAANDSPAGPLDSFLLPTAGTGPAFMLPAEQFDWRRLLPWGILTGLAALVFFVWRSLPKAA